MRYIERPPPIPERFPLARKAGEGRGEGSSLLPKASFTTRDTLILTFSRTREKGELLGDSRLRLSNSHSQRFAFLSS
jgi:hypothetical protein